MSDMTVDITQLAGRDGSPWLQPEVLETLKAIVGQLAPWQDVLYAHVESGPDPAFASFAAFTERVIVTIRLREIDGRPHTGGGAVQSLSMVKWVSVSGPDIPIGEDGGVPQAWELVSNGLVPDRIVTPGTSDASVLASIGDPLEVLDALSRIWAKQ